MSIVEDASSPEQIVHSRWKRPVVAVAVFLALSLMILMFLDRFDDRLNSVREVRDLFDEPLLGHIPRVARLGRQEPQPLKLDDDRHSFIEAYRNLRSSLLFMVNAEQRPRTLLITSAGPNEGKSLTALNLAITLANGGSRVLLVDADLRKGVLHRRLGIDASPGLSEVLESATPWEKSLRGAPYPNLSVIPRGEFARNSGDLFLNEVTQIFLKEASAKFDIVILTTQRR